MSSEELAVFWISYTVGVVLGRFQPGLPGELGSAIYRREDSPLARCPRRTKPSSMSWSVNRSASPTSTRAAGDMSSPWMSRSSCRASADTDGITVLDEGHPDDLPAEVLTALELMLGEQAAAEVVAAATGEFHKHPDSFAQVLRARFLHQVAPQVVSKAPGLLATSVAQEAHRSVPLPRALDPGHFVCYPAPVCGPQAQPHPPAPGGGALSS